MFATACPSNREAIYGMLATSPVKPQGVTASNGSAFMVAPGILITAAHCVHIETNPNKSVHNKFELIRAPDIGQKMESATLIAFDKKKDLALLKIDEPRSTACLKLLKATVPPGTPCGSLGFPLASVSFNPSGIGFNLIERFQGANISAFVVTTDPIGNKISFYETDSLMYGGSSGCPGFIASGEVFGMHNRSAIGGTGGNPKESGAGNRTRLAISMWVTSMDIVAFASINGVVL
jgi:S1-C subfamily serine protease